MEVFGFFLIVAVVIGLWVGSMSLDKSRIEGYVRERGGRIVSISWAPLGKGWFGEQSDRIYEVVYYDRAGHQHWATCKTSMLSGVYWTEDRVSHAKAGWFEGLPVSNRPGDPLIRHIPGAADAQEGAQRSANPGTLQEVDGEIAQLKRRIAELEKQRGS